MAIFEEQNPNELTEEGRRDFEVKAHELQEIFLANREFLVSWQEDQSFGIHSKQIASMIILLMKINPALKNPNRKLS